MNLRRVYPPDRFGLRREVLRELDRAELPIRDPSEMATLSAAGVDPFPAKKDGALTVIRIGGESVRVWTAESMLRGPLRPPWVCAEGSASSGLFPELELEYRRGTGGRVEEAAEWADDMLRLICRLDPAERDSWCWYGLDDTRYHHCGPFVEAGCAEVGPIALFVEHRRNGPFDGREPRLEDCLVRLNRNAILDEACAGWPRDAPAPGELLGCVTVQEMLDRAGAESRDSRRLKAGFGRRVVVA